MADQSPAQKAAQRKAVAIRTMVGDYKRANRGATDIQARHALGIPAKDTPALKAWQPPADFKPTHPHEEKKMSKSSKAIQCDPSGMGVTTGDGGHITARVGGHTVVEFDGPAIGAMLQGFLEQLLYGTSMDVVKMYPGMYPQYVQAAAANTQYCAERQMGVEMAKRLGSALRVFGITPVQWANFYVTSLENAPPLPRPLLLAGQVDGQLQQLGPGTFGTPLQGFGQGGQPLVVAPGGQFLAPRGGG